MCTSFFIFGKEPVFATNLDLDMSYRISLLNGREFCLLVESDGNLGRSLGMNEDGTCVATHICPPVKSALYRPDHEEDLHDRDIKDALMENRISVRDIPGFLRGKPYTHYPGPYGTQLICADRNSDVRIITPGLPFVSEKDFSDGFALMTNFHLQKKHPLNSLENIPRRRYKKAYGMLREYCRQGYFSDESPVDRAFDVLYEVRQRDGSRMPTIFSMVCEPSKGIVHFCINGDFSRRYRFSFRDRTVTAPKNGNLPAGSSSAPGFFSGFYRGEEKLAEHRGIPLAL